MPDANDTPEPLLVSTEEAAERLGLSVWTLRDMAASGKIAGCLRLGTRTWRWHLPTLEEFLKARMEEQRRKGVQVQRENMRGRTAR